MLLPTAYYGNAGPAKAVTPVGQVGGFIVQRSSGGTILPAAYCFPYTLSVSLRLCVKTRASASRLLARPPSLAVGQPVMAACAPEGRATPRAPSAPAARLTLTRATEGRATVHCRASCLAPPTACWTTIAPPRIVPHRLASTALFITDQAAPIINLQHSGKFFENLRVRTLNIAMPVARNGGRCQLGQLRELFHRVALLLCQFLDA